MVCGPMTLVRPARLPAWRTSVKHQRHQPRRAVEMLEHSLNLQTGQRDRQLLRPLRPFDPVELPRLDAEHVAVQKHQRA